MNDSQNLDIAGTESKEETPEEIMLRTQLGSYYKKG